MNKKEIDDLHKRNVLTKEEYDSFFRTMRIGESGELYGFLPGGTAQRKYDFDGNLLDGDLLDYVLTNVCPPLGAENIHPVFRKYGYTFSGIGDGWYWFREEEFLNEKNVEGVLPIEKASEEELWKIIAISNTYWMVFYKRHYED